jgi:predicted RNA binding protein YcfA (HicA-like mRNA interferase family)
VQESRVTQREKLLERILRGSSDVDVPFDEMRRVLSHLGFQERIRGSHHIFSKDGVEEILNIQPKGSKAKPYQVKQVRNIILKYKLGGGIYGQV